MKKLFIHKPLFRIFSPIFSGVIVYFLVLLINNNVAQIQEQFLGEELYVFILLSYLIQESSRLLLWLLRRKKITPNAGLEIVTQVVLSIVMCVFIVTVSMTLVYKYFVGYSANFEELFIFNSIFIVVSLIYVLLFVSHQYLYKIDSEKLNYEQLIKQNIEADFLQFKRDINPNLLFDSLESLLVLIEKNKEDSEIFIDNLSVIYRYILSKKDKQLVSVEEELKVANSLLEILKSLPLKSISLSSKITTNFLVVPGSILKIIESISRTTIPSDSTLEIEIIEKDLSFIISYHHNDKLQVNYDIHLMQDLVEVYSVYSNSKVEILEEGGQRFIVFPRLILS